jgi:predicted short-subunit dehydrogenase-like oxidoreductase (DUF2520 family)
VAFHLGHALKRGKVKIAGIVGRDAAKVKVLAKKLRCEGLMFGDALPASDVILIAVSDDAINTAARLLPKTEAVMAHTSGAQGMQVLGRQARTGVLWPIQSLSPGEPMDLSDTPIVVDASDREARSIMLDVAGRISSKVLELPHKQREGLHLAAAIASNLPVFLLQEAGRLLKEQNLDPGLLLPLWKSATQRAALMGPEEALTGPARRGDSKTIEKHLLRLNRERDLRRAYALLSRMILKTYGHDTDGLEEL